MAANNVHIPDQLLSELQSNALAEGKTADELAEEALRRHLAQRTLDRLRRGGERRRGRMTDAEVDQAVDRAVSEARGR